MLANAKDFRKYLWIISIYNWEECIIQDLIDLDQSRKIQFHKIFRVHQVVSLQYPHRPIVWKLIWPSIHEIVFNSIGTVTRTLVFGYPPIHFCSRLFFIFCHIIIYDDFYKWNAPKMCVQKLWKIEWQIKMKKKPSSNCFFNPFIGWFQVYIVLYYYPKIGIGLHRCITMK